MIRWQWYVPFTGGRIMPEFTTVSVTEAKLQTTSDRQGHYLHEYIDYITKLPKGEAGKLSTGAEETPATIRRRLGVAAKTLGIPVIIKRSGNDLYFWRADGGGEQPRSKRRYTRRAMEREETPTPDQPFSGSEEVNHEAVLEEESPELGQTPL
jgi:hypothetical protein